MNLLRSHSRVAASASTSIKPWRPFGGQWRGHSVMMWFAVCWSAPQSQAELLDRPHLHMCPTPVRSLLSLTQACLGRSDPGQHLDCEAMYSRSLLVDGCHSADHILAIQWAFVSVGGAVDRRSFPLVAKGRWEISLGCVSSFIESRKHSGG